MKELAKELRVAISANDHRKADGILRAGLDVNPDKFIDVLRQKGVFRFDRYRFRAETIAPLAQTALNCGISTKSKIFLTSVLAFSELAPSVAKLLKSLNIIVNSGHFKSFLVTAELLFRRGHAKLYSEKATSWQNFDKEELVEGFSYYFSLLREKETVKISDINTILSDRLDSDFYVEKLAALASIVRFREAEIQVEAFPYIASSSNLETTIQAISPQFEKSVRWGYISSEEQRNADRKRWTEEGRPSLKDLATGFVEYFGDRLFEVIEGRNARIRVHLPAIEKFLTAFAGDAFFVEDTAFIRDAMKSFFVTYDQLRNTPVYNSITLIDVLKFRRVCVFLQAALDEFCKRKNLLSTALYYRSLVGHLNEVEAAEWVSKLTGITDPKSLFELLCSTDENADVFDLQYTPIIKVAGQFLVPLGVVANCNAMRNALQRSRFRFDSGSQIDPVGDQLVAAFRQIGVNAKSNIKIRHSSIEVEADVLAVIDNHLFVFECKNSLHPCNIFELRQSHDYILKAAAQLERLRRLFDDGKFRRLVSEVAGFDMTTIVGLTTCIVTGNRMFNGHREAGHAIRNVHELTTVIVGGALTLVPFPKNPMDPTGAEVRVRVKSWGGAKISTTDLEAYIEKDSWHAPAFNAMYPYDEVITFGKRTLRFKSFMLDPGVYRDLMRKHPQAVEE